MAKRKSKRGRSTNHRPKYHRRSLEERIADLQAEIDELQGQMRLTENFAEEVASERERLELSAADYGAIVGVSGLTIYNWEKGRTSPRPKQLEQWLRVRGMDPEQAWRQLGLA